MHYKWPNVIFECTSTLVMKALKMCKSSNKQIGAWMKPSLSSRLCDIYFHIFQRSQHFSTTRAIGKMLNRQSTQLKENLFFTWSCREWNKFLPSFLGCLDSLCKNPTSGSIFRIHLRLLDIKISPFSFTSLDFKLRPTFCAKIHFFYFDNKQNYKNIKSFQAESISFRLFSHVN